MTRTMKDTQHRANQLLDAAEELFISQGFQQVNISDIVKKISVAQGTFYNYFASKESILEALIARDFARVLETYRQRDGKHSGGVQEKLGYLFELLREKAKGRAVFQRLFQEKNLHLIDRIRRQRDESLTEVITEILVAGNSSGEIQVPYPVETAAFILLSIHFVADGSYGDGEPESFARRACIAKSFLAQALGISEDRLDQRLLLRRFFD